MKSSLKLPLAIAFALGSAPALALQLGQIQVKSALDEPLVAEIPIQLDNLSEAKDLRVELASPADFSKAGLTRAGLEHLRFSIVSDSTGHKLVLVTSDQPIGDPYLDFLLEIDTSTGKQLREYTVLLDPVIASPPPQVASAPTAAQAPQEPVAPVESPAQTAPASPPPSVYSAPVQQPAPAPQPVAPPRAATPITSPRASEYTVQRGDTLYRIAAQTRPDDQVNVDQMMLALQNTNPDAFYKNNINNLKSGAILRIPTRDEIDSAPAGKQARAQIHRQIEDWRGAAAHQATTVAGTAEAPAESAQAKPAASEGDRLALVPPTQGGGSAATRAGEKGGTDTAQVAGIKQQLATAKESLASLKQENSELQSRVHDLEDISGKNQKLLAMKDAQIAELQRKLAEAQAAAKSGVAAPAASVAGASSAPKPAASVAAPAASSVAAAPKSAVTSAPASSSPAAANIATAASAASAQVAKPAATGKPAPHVAPAVHNPPAEEVPWYQRPIAWVAAGIVILALILLGLLRRRPRSLPDLEPETPSLADHFGESPLPPRALVEDETPHTEAFAEEAGAQDEPIAAVPTEPAPEHEYDFAFDELPQEEPVAEPGMPPAQPPVAGADEITREHRAARFADTVDEPVHQRQELPPLMPEEEQDIVREQNAPAFSDDPVDTKLDLARAYLDMGDPAGARAMLEEVLNEGSQTQKDEAKRLLESV